MDRTMIPYWN